MSKEYCAECGKPLGSTEDKCFEHGGTGSRGGKPISPHQWQIILGVEPGKFKELNFEARNIESDEHHAHHAASGFNE